MLWTLMLGIAAIANLCVAAADPIEDFYKGRTIRFITGHPAGTEYDVWARLLSRHWGRLLPGNPGFQIDYMPGAGQIIAANYLYNIAEKNGATLLMLERSLPNYALGGDPNIKFDPARFGWIGSAEMTNRACAAVAGAPVQKTEDLFTRELIVGGAGPGSGFSQTPLLLSKLLGMKFKLVEGYGGAQATLLAMERGEIQGLCNSMASFRAVWPGWIEQGKLKVLFTMLHAKDPELPGVPTIYEYTTSDEQRQIIDLYMVSLEFGRPVITTPDVPADRLAALRRSFDAMVADAEFKADAAKLKYTLTLRKGEELEDIAKRLMATPKDIAAKMSTMTK